MKTVKVIVTKELETLRAMHTLTFPGDSQPDYKPDGLAWIVYDAGDPVAFLYCEPITEAWYFSRVGVMPAARGKGLQRVLMRRMVKDLRDRGVSVIVSTTYQNPPSANNFVREQWMTYNPAVPWGSPDTIYWRKDLEIRKS